MSADPAPETPARPARRRRWLRRLLIGIPLFLAALLAVLFFVLQYKLGAIVKWGAEKYGPEVLGAPVTLSNCHARIFSGRLELDGLVIGPPEDRADPDVRFKANLFEMPHFMVDVDPRSVIDSSGPVVIREIVIDGPFVTYELQGLRANINALLDNVNGAGKPAPAPQPQPEATPKPAEPAPAAPAEPPPAPKPERKVYIETFLFTNAHVRCALVNGKGLVVPLPTIRLEGIGRKDVGTTKWEAIRQILASIGRGTVDAVGSAGGAVVGLVGDAAELALDVGKAVGGAALDAGEAVVGAAGDALGAAGDAVGSGLSALGGLVGLGGDGDGDGNDDTENAD